MGDEDVFHPAEDGAGTPPPPSSSVASTSSKSKPAAAAAAGDFESRMLASMCLQIPFSSATGRYAAPSSPKTPTPQPPAGPNLGRDHLLPHQGPHPSADGCLSFDTSVRNIDLPATPDSFKQLEEVLGEQGAAEEGKGHVIGHGVDVRGEQSVLALMGEEGREKEDVVDLGIINGDLDKEGEQQRSDELGTGMEDQEVMDQEGATMFYTAVECKSSNNSEQWAGDAPAAIKDDSAVEEKEIVEQGCAVGILGESEDGFAGGLQEDEDGNVVEDKEKAVHQEAAINILCAVKGCVDVVLREEDMVVEARGEHDISEKDQYNVVKQCTSDELDASLGGSTVQYQEVVVEQAEYASPEDHNNNTSVMQCTSDELSEVKDSNIAKMKEKTLEQEGNFGILGAAENCVSVSLLGEDNLVVEGQGADGISVQDQHKLVEQCITDDLGFAMGDSVVQDQAVAVLDLEGVTRCFDAAVEDHLNNCAELCTSDELEATKDDSFVEEKKKAVVEGSIDILGSAKDDIKVRSQEEGDAAVLSEGDGDVVSLQDHYKGVKQCSSYEVRTTGDVKEQSGDGVSVQGQCKVALKQVSSLQLKAKPGVPCLPSEQENREAAQILELNCVGLPIREDHSYYMRKCTGGYGRRRCFFNHPKLGVDVQLYATLDDISSILEILPSNILQMTSPLQTMLPDAEANETKVKKIWNHSCSTEGKDFQTSHSLASMPSIITAKVYILNHTVSVSVDKVCTLEHIVEEVSKTLNINLRDMYFTNNRRVVPSGSQIKESCVLVAQHRLRGGVRSGPIRLKELFRTLMAHDKWLEKVDIPPELGRQNIDLYAVKLSEDSESALSKLLMSLERIHASGLSYAGKFGINEIWYVPDMDSFEIVGSLVPITQEYYVMDVRVIKSVINRFFKYRESDNSECYPIYLQDLVEKIEKLEFTGVEFRSTRARSLIFLHIVTWSTWGRVKLVDALMVYFHRLDSVAAKEFKNALGPWEGKVDTEEQWVDSISINQTIPETLNLIFKHGNWNEKAKRKIPKTYSHDTFGWLDYIRCLFTHADKGTIKQLDAVVARIWEYGIPRVQEALIIKMEVESNSEQVNDPLAAGPSSSSGNVGKFRQVNDPLAAGPSSSSEVAALAMRHWNGIDLAAGEINPNATSSAKNTIRIGEFVCDVGADDKGTIKQLDAVVARIWEYGIPIKMEVESNSEQVNDPLAAGPSSSSGNVGKFRQVNDPLAAGPSSSSEVAALAMRHWNGIDLAAGEINPNATSSAKNTIRIGEFVCDVGAETDRPNMIFPSRTITSIASIPVKMDRELHHILGFRLKPKD